MAGAISKATAASRLEGAEYAIGPISPIARALYCAVPSLCRDLLMVASGEI